LLETGCDDKKQQTKTNAVPAAETAGSANVEQATLAKPESEGAAAMGNEPTTASETAKTGDTDETEGLSAKFPDGMTVKKAEVLKRIELLPERVRGIPFSQLYNLVLFVMIQEKLAYASAVKSGFDKTEKIASAANKLKEGVIQQYYLDEHGKKLITQQAIEEQYSKLVASFVVEDEFCLRHILVKTKEEAAKILNELAAGASFDELQEKHSLDRKGLDGGRKGRLGAFRVSQLPEVEAPRIVSTKVGSFVPVPVHVPNTGYSVLLVEEKRPSTPAPLEKVRDRVKNILLKRFALQHVADLCKANGVKLFAPDGTVIPTKSVDERLEELKARRNASPDSMSEADRKNEALVKTLSNESVVAEFGDGTKVTFAQIAAFIRENIEMFRGNNSKEHEIFVTALEEYVSRAILRKAASESGIEKKAHIAAKIYDAVCSFIAHEQVIELADKTVTEDEIRNYYEHTVATVDRSKPECRVRVIPVSSADRGKEAINALKAGKDFDIVMEEFCSDQRFRDKKGDMGYLNEKQLTMLSAELCKAVMEAPTATIVLTPIEVNGQLLVIRVEDKRQPEIPPYSESKSSIRQRLVQERAIAVTQKLFLEAGGTAWGLDGQVIDIGDPAWAAELGRMAIA
jgi:peptidyl-prolyl cis-trans isomerase C